MTAHERSVCEERVLVPHSPREIALRFLRTPERDRALALEALFDSVGSIPRQATDPSVGAAKLAWWRDEIQRAPASGSQHPLVSGLRRTGALDERGVANWTAYVVSVAQELQAEATQDLEELWRRMVEAGGREAMWLTGLGGGEGGASAGVSCAGAAGHLLARLEQLGVGQNAPDWVPLDLLARHGLSREELARDPTDLRVAGLAGELAEFALDRLDETSGQWPSLVSDGAEGAGLQYLAARVAVERRRLMRLRARPSHALVGEPKRGLLMDVLSAWRAARRYPASLLSEG